MLASSTERNIYKSLTHNFFCQKVMSLDKENVFMYHLLCEWNDKIN
jgi:hypothetical protein